MIPEMYLVFSYLCRTMGVPAIYSWHISAGCKSFIGEDIWVTCVMWWHNMVNPACLLYRACSDAWLQHCNTELLWQISQRSTYHHHHSLHLYMAVWFRTEIFLEFFFQSIHHSLIKTTHYILQCNNWINLLNSNIFWLIKKNIIVSSQFNLINWIFQ